MTTYITKDINETLDYTFIRTVEDNIVNVSYSQDGGGNVTVDSCNVNVNTVTDSNGNTYPAGRAIIIWLSNGDSGTTEKIVITYTTAAGRVLDEAVIVSLVSDN